MRNDGISVKIIIATAVCIAVLLFTSFFPVSLPQPSSHSTAVSLPCTATASPTHSFSITLNGTPKGNGTYQQLFTIGNSTYPFSNYGINSQGSNFLISYSNGTDAYSWIQSINTTSIKLWSKVLNGTVRLDLNVYATTENLFNASGFLGDNKTSNANLVFNPYINNETLNGNGAIMGMYTGGTGTSYEYNLNVYPSTNQDEFGYQNNYTGSGLYVYQTPSNYKVHNIPNIPYNATNIYAVWAGYTTGDNVSETWQIDNYSGNQSGNISVSNVYVGFLIGYATAGGIRTLFWRYSLTVPNGIMPTYTITPQLNFTHTVYTYTVYIATVTNENPAYTASGLTNLTFKATGYSWAYFPSSDKLEVNPPPYLIFSNITGNYGVYNITMQMTATSNITHKTITATAYAEVTVIGYVRLNVTKITQSANSLFPTLTEREIMFLITAVVSIVVALILMSFVAERKVKRKEEEKYEKEWLKHD